MDTTSFISDITDLFYIVIIILFICAAVGIGYYLLTGKRL